MVDTKPLFAFASEYELRNVVGDCQNIDAQALGVGILEFATNLNRAILQRKERGEISSVILLGICGAYRQSGLNMGDVVCVESEIVGDLGAENRDGSFLPWPKIASEPVKVYQSADMGIAPAWLCRLKHVRGLSVNCCTGTERTAQFRYAQYGSHVESMEGAACFAICDTFSIPAFEVRAVSNYVGDRDKSKWDVETALRNLRQVICI
ncbi:MAG: futalosine hydrolase [Fibrobacter sp.]|nr:futalosine hydrolase [Fibrobacter sp.]